MLWFIKSRLGVEDLRECLKENLENDKIISLADRKRQLHFNSSVI